ATIKEQGKVLVENFFGETIDETTKIKKINQSTEVMGALKKLINLCGDNAERDGVEETPYRVVKAFLEYTEGYREDPKTHLEKTFDVDHNELVLVKDIEFYSMCEHHFAPFFGVAHI